MADIDLERKESMPIWPWLLGLAALALLGWAAAEAMRPEEPVMAPATVPAPEEAEVVEEPEVVVGVEPVLVTVLSAPEAYLGERFLADRVQVAEVPTDRGFWISQDGERLFVILIDQPREEPKDIDPGDVLRLEEGTFRDGSSLSEIPGVPLDQDTRAIARAQDIFLVVDERNVRFLSRAGEEGAPDGG